MQIWTVLKAHANEPLKSTKRVSIEKSDPGMQSQFFVISNWTMGARRFMIKWKQKVAIEVGLTYLQK